MRNSQLAEFIHVFTLKRVHRRGIALAVWVVLACGCGSKDARVQPAIEFTAVPPAATGGSDRLARIAGRAAGARPGDRIVLYTKSGVWWVQPLTGTALYGRGGGLDVENLDPPGQRIRRIARRRRGSVRQRPWNRFRNAGAPFWQSRRSRERASSRNRHRESRKSSRSAVTNGRSGRSPAIAAARMSTIRPTPGQTPPACSISGLRSATDAGPARK